MRVALIALFAAVAQASVHDHASAARKMLKVDQPAPLPEQGYHGKGVAHSDMETMTSDWATEYGPKSKGAIAQGYGVPAVKPSSPVARSGASRAAGVMTALAAVALSQAF